MELPRELLGVAERLAELCHDARLFHSPVDGLSAGAPVTPFRELPETEREEELARTAQLLKLMLAHGCRIEPPATVEDEEESSDQEVTDLVEAKDSPLSLLVNLWQTRDTESWSSAPTLYINIARQFLKLGEPLFAYDVLAEAIEIFSDHAEVRQLLALSLARIGSPRRAEVILDELLQQGFVDEETLGVKARIHKDLWQSAKDPQQKARHLELAYQNYAEAYRLTQGYWTGINAATMALMLGRKGLAGSLAEKVHRQCLDEIDSNEDETYLYWPLATLGEAALILGRWDEAEQWYSKAVEYARGKVGDLASTRRNAQLLIEFLGVDPARFEKCFSIPSVVVFTGHMIDRPDRAEPRFPAVMEAAVAAEIRKRLDRLNGGVGFASGACGSDILFMEAMLAREGEAHLVLPFRREEFIRESVAIISDSDWVSRFETVLSRAAQVVVGSDARLGSGSVCFEYANDLLRGLGCIRAAQLNSTAVLLTVWDGKRGDGPGGTESMVEAWKKTGRRVEIIDTNELLRMHSVPVPTPSPEPQPAASPPAAASKTSVRSILFADLANFSELTEEEIPFFTEHFLGGIAALLESSPWKPEVKNTWGDGLYFAFASVRSAGQFSLALRDFVRDQDWEAKGLRQRLAIRIGLHVGPVYGFVDPITSSNTYVGSHVSRTARIEPITPPGKVYASQAFAALASAESDTGFKCEYVGQTPLAKGFGTFPTYHVRRA